MKSNGDSETPYRPNIATRSLFSQQARYRPYRDDSTTPRLNVLPDVVAKTLLSRNFAGLTKRKHSFGTPVSTKSESINNSQTQLQDEIKLSNSIDDKTSPGLARLRMTPGAMREKQRRLIDQHDIIRLKGDQLRTGGGISLWPEMNQMRLTNSELLWLSVQAVGLLILSLQLLKVMHGATFSELNEYADQVTHLCEAMQISDMVNQTQFQNQVVSWHDRLLSLTDSIQRHFDITAMSTSYQFCIVTYMLGLMVLLYYLLDNMLAKNKLTPSRIKKWTCLLVIIGTWTGMMAYGLYCACLLEQQVTRCVQRYASSLAFLVVAPLDLNLYQAVLLYWRARFLDNASPGLLSVLGVVSVRDLVYYLQYYSVPIVTVIVSPVVKLCCSCLAVYRQGEYLRATS